MIQVKQYSTSSGLQSNFALNQHAKNKEKSYRTSKATTTARDGGYSPRNNSPLRMIIDQPGSPMRSEDEMQY